MVPLQKSLGLLPSLKEVDGPDSCIWSVYECSETETFVQSAFRPHSYLGGAAVFRTTCFPPAPFVIFEPLLSFMSNKNLLFTEIQDKVTIFLLCWVKCATSINVSNRSNRF